MVPVPRWAWWAGAGAAAIALVSMATQRTGFTLSNVTEEDLDALTRMLLAEQTGGTPAERAQIVLVAVNRARKYNAPLATVVKPGTRTPIRNVRGGTWNGGQAYKERYQGAHSSSKYPAWRKEVVDVLRGSHPNRGYTSFIHPAGMPTAPCSSDRVLMSTFKGPRCMPQWGLRPTDRVNDAYFYA